MPCRCAERREQLARAAHEAVRLRPAKAIEHLDRAARTAREDFQQARERARRLYGQMFKVVGR